MPKCAKLVKENVRGCLVNVVDTAKVLIVLLVTTELAKVHAWVATTAVRKLLHRLLWPL